MCGAFTVPVLGVVIGMGTLTLGFHLVDDWEFAKYVDWMTLRFRPLYYINRVLIAAVFGILFALTVMVGCQSAVWWKLEPQESYGIMMFA